MAVNLREFSKLVGLSPTTVSRALSGYPEVKSETRKRVRDEALRLGYHPNRNAAGLSTGRADAIGIVVWDEGIDPGAAEIFTGLASRLEHDGIDIVLSKAASRAAELLVYRRLVASKKVDAIVLLGPSVHDERVALLEELNIPFVLHGRTETSKSYAYVDIDNFGAVQQATSHLLDLGHRNIAFINGYKGMTFVEDRERGFRAAFSEHGLEPHPGQFANGPFTDEFGYTTTRSLLGSANPPTAIIASFMTAALGAMRAIRAAGLTVGRDISLIAHDDVFPYLSADGMIPPLSTTRSSVRAGGWRVGDFVVQLLAGKKPEALQEVWPVELVLRRSTARPAPAPGIGGPAPQQGHRQASNA